MMNKIILVVLSLFIWFSFLRTGYASNNSYEVIEVRHILEKTEEETCTKYRLLVYQDQNGLQEKEYCLSGGKRYGGGESYIWVINNKVSRITEQFFIYVYFDEKTSERAITVRTVDYPFEASEYIAFNIPLLSDEKGKHLCVLTANGIIPVKRFKELFLKSDGPQFENTKSIEKKIRKMQPWCES